MYPSIQDSKITDTVISRFLYHDFQAYGLRPMTGTEDGRTTVTEIRCLKRKLSQSG